MPDVLMVFALIGIVLTTSALISGLVERAPLSFPLIFLGLGLLLGEQGLGLITLDPQDKTLEAVAILSLVFVLFLDALRLRFDALRTEWVLPMLVLGPGTLLTIALLALAAWLCLGTSLIQSLLLGAILSSTDPVVLRDVVRDRRLPRSIRQTLGIEAGTNDIVVLPIVLVLIAIAHAGVGSTVNWLAFLGQLLVLGPLAGVAVGGIGAWVLSKADAWLGVSRTYQALYGVGLILGSYVAGVWVGGDGFLAAFAAGMAITVFNYDLCDCFLEYGDATAEMTMLLAFILFGAVLSTLLGTIALGPALLFAVLAVGLARPLVISLILRSATLSRAARAFIGWFGPRGLNSLLLALLAVHAHVPQAEWLLAITGVVVIVSVIVHGITATPLSAWYGRKVARETLPEERESTAAGLLHQTADAVPLITPQELAQRLSGPQPPIVLDVRSRAAYREATAQIPGSIRVLPDQILEWATGQSRQRPIVAYCT
jgi:NhaP-type Na+/H+ or K+/H+ antiporter